MKAIDLKIGGIKCDNPNCDFRDDSVLVDDYKKWLNKPCPKCGANLLTKKDYKMTKRIIRLCKIINKVFPKDCNTEDQVKGKIIMNGTGKINVDFDTNDNKGV